MHSNLSVLVGRKQKGNMVQSKASIASRCTLGTSMPRLFLEDCLEVYLLGVSAKRLICPRLGVMLNDRILQSSS